MAVFLRFSVFASTLAILLMSFAAGRCRSSLLSKRSLLTQVVVVDGAGGAVDGVAAEDLVAGVVDLQGEPLVDRRIFDEMYRRFSNGFRVAHHLVFLVYGLCQENMYCDRYVMGRIARKGSSCYCDFLREHPMFCCHCR